MTDADLAFAPAREQARLVREGAVSSRDLVDLYLDRIERFDPRLNAYVTVAADAARADAERADRAVRAGDDLGPFHGVPIAIKDLTRTAGIRTTYSSALYADHVPEADDHVVTRIRRAGFVLLGKTNTPEFGALPVTESVLNGACRNPWNLERTPGGSSGGSGAAVAAGLAPVAHGTDGGGSVRIPAACCGLFGLKPSRGRISSGPELGESVCGYSVNGFLGRSVADIAALLDVTAGYEVGDPYWAPPPDEPFAVTVARIPRPLRVAVCAREPIRGEVHDDCVAAVRDAAELLTGLGHVVEEAAPSLGDEDVIECLDQLWSVAAAYHCAAEDLDHLEPVNREFSRRAFGLTSFEYVRASIAMTRAAREFVGLWQTYDLLLTPTLSVPPVPIGWYFGGKEPGSDLVRDHTLIPIYTPFANVTGQPAVSLPLSWNSAGLPIGVQLIGPPAGEGLLLQVASSLEAARPWAHRRPPIG